METDDSVDIDSAAIFEEIQLRKEVNRYGNIRYFNNDNQLHRELGPAAVFIDGSQRWYRNGMLHRTDGPAITWSNGNRYWYLDGKEYSKENYLKHVHKFKDVV